MIMYKGKKKKERMNMPDPSFFKYYASTHNNINHKSQNSYESVFQSTSSQPGNTNNFFT